MRTVLVYHLYYNNEFENGITGQIHKYCLQHYNNVFNDAIFVISVADLSDGDAIKKALSWVSEVRNGRSFTVKVKLNSDLYETDTFNEEVLKNVDTLRDAVFFAHSKGCSRVDDKEMLDGNIINTESVFRWITSMYYFGLNFMDEVTDRFCGHKRASEFFYGPFLTTYNDPSESPMLRLNVHNWFYQGTFFWLNMRKFSNFLKAGKINLNEPDDRYWTEMLPGTLFDRDEWGDGLSSHKDIGITNGFNLYTMDDDEWTEMFETLGEPEAEDFYKGIMEKIRWVED